MAVVVDRSAEEERDLARREIGALMDTASIGVATYDPARRWPVRVQLHGGVVRQDPEEGRRRRGQRLPGEPQIVVEPFGWGESAWWHTSQVDNILGSQKSFLTGYTVSVFPTQAGVSPPTLSSLILML